jgi:hypothetical protein
MSDVGFWVSVAYFRNLKSEIEASLSILTKKRPIVATIGRFLVKILRGAF